MKTIKLYGSLKKQFGNSFTFDVETVQMAISALVYQIKGFREALASGQFYLILGSKKKGLSLDVSEVGITFGRSSALHIIPAIQGAGGGGFRTAAKIVIGASLLIAAPFAAGLAGPVGVASAQALAIAGAAGKIAATVGAALVVSGVSGMLAPRPDVTPLNYESRETPDARQSALYNGPINRAEQGAPIPLVYGRVRAGSLVASVGVTTEASS